MFLGSWPLVHPPSSDPCFRPHASPLCLLPPAPGDQGPTCTLCLTTPVQGPLLGREWGGSGYSHRREAPVPTSVE